MISHNLDIFFKGLDIAAVATTEEQDRKRFWPGLARLKLPLLSYTRELGTGMWRCGHIWLVGGITPPVAFVGPHDRRMNVARNFAGPLQWQSSCYVDPER